MRQPLSQARSMRPSPSLRLASYPRSNTAPCFGTVPVLARRARCVLDVAPSFDPAATGATLAAGFATSAVRREAAVQIRATATARFSNFLMGFRSPNGRIPANVFQVATGRDIGAAAASAGPVPFQW